MTSGRNISIYGAQPEPTRDISPQKRAAENMAGMFVPLEVKFQDLTQFDKMAKKNFSGNKYPTISPREEVPHDQIEEPQPIAGSGLMHYGRHGGID